MNMAIDPVCGMTVDEASAKSAERNGQTPYFYGVRWSRNICQLPL